MALRALGIGFTRTFCIILIGVLPWHGEFVSGQTYALDGLLRTTLQTNYTTSVRPDTPTNVTIGFFFRSLSELDVATETMKTTGWFSLMWHDPRLMWDPTDYSNITFVDLTWAWRPTFVISNSNVEFETLGSGKTVVRAAADGSLRLNVPLILSTVCSADITKFPFDTQTCFLEVIFWDHNTDEVNLVLMEDPINFDVYVPNGEWEVASFSSETVNIETCCPEEAMPAMNSTLTFKRMRPYYVINILLPTLLMSVCIMWTFLLPVESGERVGYSITIMLTFTVLLTITSDFLPTSSIQTPYIASYIMVVLIFSLAAVILTVITLKLYNIEGSPPKIVQRIFRYLGIVLFCGCKCPSSESSQVSTMPGYGQDSEHSPSIAKQPTFAMKLQPNGDEKVQAFELPPEPEPETTWREISEILDRLFLYLFLFGTVIINVVLLVALNGADGVEMSV